LGVTKTAKKESRYVKVPGEKRRKQLAVRLKENATDKEKLGGSLGRNLEDTRGKRSYRWVLKL